MKSFYLSLSLLLSIVTFAKSNTIEKVIYFCSDSDSLTPESKVLLDSLVWKMNSEAVAYFNIKSYGFTDSTGFEDNNLILSRKRAEIVYLYIINRATKPMRNNEVVAFGSKNPVASNTLPAGRAKSRRTVVYLELNQISPGTPSNDTLFVEGGAMVIFPPGTLPNRFDKIRFSAWCFHDAYVCASCNISTITSTGECLSTGGMLFVDATIDSSPVSSLAGTDSIIIRIPSKNYDERMELFTIEKNAKGDNVWKPFKVTLKYDSATSYYEFKTRNLGGYNIDKYVNEICVKADICKIKTRSKEEKVFITYTDVDLNSVISTKSKKAKHYLGTIVESRNPSIVTVFKKGEDNFSLQVAASKIKKRGANKVYVIRKKYYRLAKKLEECPVVN